MNDMVRFEIIIVLFRPAKIRYFFHTNQRALTNFYKNLKNTYDQVPEASESGGDRYFGRSWPCFYRTACDRPAKSRVLGGGGRPEGFGIESALSGLSRSAKLRTFGAVTALLGDRKVLPYRAQSGFGTAWLFRIFGP